MHTVSLSVPVYVKHDNIYILERCVAIQNGRSLDLQGFAMHRFMSLLKSDLANSVSMFVKKGDKLLVSLCDGQQYTYNQDTNPLDYPTSTAIEESDSSVVVGNETALCFVDDERKIVSAGALFDHNTAFKRRVPACWMHTYIENVCKAQSATSTRLFNHVRWYDLTKLDV